jgi:hypothetical protein
LRLRQVAFTIRIEPIIGRSAPGTLIVCKAKNRFIHERKRSLTFLAGGNIGGQCLLARSIGWIAPIYLSCEHASLSW